MMPKTWITHDILLYIYFRMIECMEDIYEDAEIAKANGDQELAFIKFSDFVKFCSALEEWQDFDPGSDVNRDHIVKWNRTLDKLKESIWNANRLQSILKKRYEKESSDQSID